MYQDLRLGRNQKAKSTCCLHSPWKIQISSLKPLASHQEKIIFPYNIKTGRYFIDHNFDPAHTNNQVQQEDIGNVINGLAECEECTYKLLKKHDLQYICKLIVSFVFIIPFIYLLYKWQGKRDKHEKHRQGIADSK